MPSGSNCTNLLTTVTDLADICECESSDTDFCQLRMSPPVTENGAGVIGCFGSVRSFYTPPFLATHNPSLEEYNDGVPFLTTDNKYMTICRDAGRDERGTYNLYSIKTSDLFQLPTGGADLPPELAALAGIPMPGAQPADPNHFPACDARLGDNNGAKVPSIWLTQADADYLSGKFTSHDRMAGCFLQGQGPDHNGMTQYWLTTSPEILGGLNEGQLHFVNGVIDKINDDIRAGQVPAGIGATDILTSLINIGGQSQYVQGVRAQRAQREDSERIREQQERDALHNKILMGIFLFVIAAPLLKALRQKITGRVRTTDFGETIRSRILAERAAGRSYDVLGRDREARDAWVMTDTASYRNIMVDAPTQVGKDEVVRKMIIMKEMAALGLSDRGPIPEEFVNAKVVKINAAEFQRGTSLRGNVADKVAEIADWARKGPVIVYVSEIDLILLSGGSSIDADGRPSSNTESPGKLLLDLLGEDSAPESWIHRTLRRIPGVGRFFKPPTTGIRDNIIMIGTTSRYQEVLEKYPDLQARFNQLRIDNLHLSEMVNVIYDGMTRTEYETRYRVKISKDIVDAAARIAEQLYRPVTTRTDRYTGEARNLNRFPAAKQILEGAAKIARARIRASTGSGAATQPNDVTIEDVIKSTEQRIGMTLDRAKVDALLRVENIDSIELPDNEPPTQRRAGGPRGPDDPPPAPAADGAGTGGVPAAAPPQESGAASYSDETQRIYGLSLSGAYAFAAPYAEGKCWAPGFEPVAVGAQIAAGGSELRVQTPIFYRTIEGVRPNMTPSSGGGIPQMVEPEAVGNPSGALPGSLLAMFGVDLGLGKLLEWVGLDHVAFFQDVKQLTSFGAGQYTAVSVATGRSFAEVLFDPRVAADFGRTGGAFFFITDHITNPVLRDRGITPQSIGKLPYALVSLAAPIGTYSIAYSAGTALMATLESLGFNRLSGLLGLLGKGAAYIGWLDFGARALPHLQEATNRGTAALFDIDMSDADANRYLAREYGLRYHLQISDAIDSGQMTDREVNMCVGGVHLVSLSDSWPRSYGPPCDTDQIKEIANEVNGEARESAGQMRQAVAEILFQQIQPTLIESLTRGYNGISDPSAWNIDIDTNRVRDLLAERISAALPSTYAMEDEHEKQNVDYMKALLTHGQDSEEVKALTAPTNEEMELALNAVVRDFFKQLQGFELPFESDLPLFGDELQDSIARRNSTAIATKLINNVFDSNFERVGDINETSGNYLAMRRTGYLMANADENGVVDRSVAIYASDLSSDLLSEIRDPSGELLYYSINRGQHFERIMALAEVARQLSNGAAPTT